jgi:hypothetical protein
MKVALNADMLIGTLSAAAIHDLDVLPLCLPLSVRVSSIDVFFSIAVLWVEVFQQKLCGWQRIPPS